MKDFLYEGFNVDKHGKIVFDGMFPIISAARRTWTNAAFAQPGRWSKQHEDHFMPGFQFPFTYATMTDPVSGVSDGILKALHGDQHLPEDHAARRRVRMVGRRGVAGRHRRTRQRHHSCPRTCATTWWRGLSTAAETA